ncbi:MAG: DUF4249 domain-containing protein [Bacteroidota bacterium]
MLLIKRLFFVATALLFACTEPISPEFEFESGLIYVDAFISNIPGSSFVTIAESKFEFDFFRNEFLGNAEVLLLNTDNGLEVTFSESEESYVPPEDLTITAGESWELHITLEDGRRYKSLPEIASSPVPISEIEASYDPELEFNLDEDDFVPGHKVLITFDDPSEVDNFYFWRFRSFERLVVCERCAGGIFRDSECVSFEEYNAQNSPGVNEDGADPEYTYICERDCWRIRFNEKIEVFSDEFANGVSGNRLGVADVLLYTKNDILVEMQQYALTAEGYRYFRILKDIVDNNGNFNAPPPAALLGNMFNVDDGNEFVLGRFTIGLASTASIFIDRTAIEDEPLEQERINTESSELFFGNGLLVRSTAPCREGRFRTGTPPSGWISN